MEYDCIRNLVTILFQIVKHSHLAIGSH